MRFEKPYPFHPNVNQDTGRLCFSLLNIPEVWVKENKTSILDVLESIVQFVKNPDFPNGYCEAPRLLYEGSGQIAYIKKLKELRQTNQLIQ